MLWLSTGAQPFLAKDVTVCALDVFTPLQNCVDLLTPSSRDVPAETLFGTVGFACENGSMSANSVS
ncbi:MAG: hypothetical protein ABL861_07995 [Nitrosomonas sp.]